MKSSRLEEDKNLEESIIKYVRNLFRLKKTAIKGIRNPFRLKKYKTVKYRILRDIKNLFEHEEADYYKPVIVNNFYRNKNNQKPYMINESKRFKMVTLLKSLKDIYVLIFCIHVPESIFSGIWKVNPEY